MLVWNRGLEHHLKTPPAFLDIMDEKDFVHSTSGSPSMQYYGSSSRAGLATRLVDSFRRDPRAHTTPKGTVGGDGRVYDVENAATATAESPLARRLKGRHLQMIAIGGSIGTLFSLAIR